LKTIKTPAIRFAMPFVLSMLAAAAMSFSLPVKATQFGVRVVNESGEPVPGASVCIGLPGNYKQFGALFTDIDGKAVVDVPNVPLVVTVSKTRFRGTRISEPARGFNLIKEVTLSEGVPGPHCKAGSSMAANPPSIVIADVDISSGGESTTLRPTVSGEPSHYRVGASSGFENVGWQRFEEAIALPSALTRQGGEVFLQMRRFEGTSKGWVEARSNVVTVQLPMVR
jgi:hypothetical protein